jgi:hypothetical protein
VAVVTPLCNLILILVNLKCPTPRTSFIMTWSNLCSVGEFYVTFYYSRCYLSWSYESTERWGLHYVKWVLYRSFSPRVWPGLCPTGRIRHQVGHGLSSSHCGSMWPLTSKTCVALITLYLQFPAGHHSVPFLSIWVHVDANYSHLWLVMR